MKKLSLFLAVLLAVSCLFSLSACKGDKETWLTEITADHLATIASANDYGVKVKKGADFDDKQAKSLFIGYSSADLATVKTALEGLKKADFDAMYPTTGTIYLRERELSYVGGESMALSKGSFDFINKTVDMMATPGTYYIYVIVVGDNGLLWVGRLEEAIVRTDASTGDQNWDETFAIPNIKLVECDPFDFSLTGAKQFRMHADVYLEKLAEGQTQSELYNKLDSVLMLYSVKTLAEIQAYIKENIKTGVDIEALDTANRVRLLNKGKRLEYLATDNPASTGFYGVAVDFVTLNSIEQTPGVYHFYMASVANGQIKWVGEAQKTVEITPDTIDVRNALIDFVYSTVLESDNKDAANWAPEVKAEAIKKSIVAEIGTNITGLTVTPTFKSGNIFTVTISKGAVSASREIDVIFGPPADPTAWLTEITADHLPEIKTVNDFGIKVKKGFAFDKTLAKSLFIGYSSADLATVKAALAGLTRADFDAMYPVEGKIYMRQRGLSYVDDGGTMAPSEGSFDFINKDVDMMVTPGTYYLYVVVVGDDGMLWVGRLEQAIVRVDPTAWLANITADHLDPLTSVNDLGVKIVAGPAFDATLAKSIFIGYSSADLATVKAALAGLTRADFDAMYPVEGAIYLRERKLSYVTDGKTMALSKGSFDFINKTVDMMATPGTYYIYVIVVGDNGLLWVGRLEQAIVRS
ncbi:MAG: hypothetical protein RR248_00855 [Clostridia bacterium]